MMLQSFRMAFSSILSNKMRSFLTMLGIIIGVMAVVVLISLVNGATTSVTSEIEGLGTNLLTVTVRSQAAQGLTPQDIKGFAEQFDSIRATAPSLSQPVTARNGSKTFDATVQGTTAAYDTIGGLSLASGRFLKSPDNDNQSAVAVVGVDVADELFGTQKILGESITVNGRKLLIVGVLEKGTSTFGGDDEKIIIPFSLAQRMFQQKNVQTFYAAAESSETVDAAEADLTNALLRFFRQDEDAFSILNQAAILDTMDSILGTLSLLLGGIAGISLLVGGIGIMNIMLVSVAERTREIGIRKAIGAGRKRILLQFLIESLVISILGGLIGLLVSWLILRLAGALANMSFAMTPDVIILAFGFSVFIGVVFGLYPANKASKLHPIDALRTE